MIKDDLETRIRSEGVGEVIRVAHEEGESGDGIECQGANATDLPVREVRLRRFTVQTSLLDKSGRPYLSTYNTIQYIIE